MAIRLKTPGEIEAMRRAGAAVGAALRAMQTAIVPGETTTLHLDEVAQETLKRFDAVPALLGYKPSFSRVPYRHATCISINHEVIHGVPRADRVLREGDLVSLDMDAAVDGWLADAALTVAVGGKATPKAQRLIQVTREALYLGIAQAKVGGVMGDIGSAIQRHVEKNGMNVVRDMVGHGIGTQPHEPGLDVPNWGTAGKGTRLQAGMTICIEPMVMLGKHEVEHAPNDVWTIVTRDGSLAAHFEHTVALTDDGPVILTNPPKE